MKKNDIFNVKIIDMNMLGFGIAKIENFVVFVQNGVTNDFCEIKIIKVAKSYAVARIEKLIESSEYRIDPKCKHYLRCGGCSFQHISYNYELEIKKNYIQSELKKNGISDIEVFDVISNGNVSGYRNKAQFPLSICENGVSIGFFSPKSHKICPIENCEIQNPQFSDICKFITNYMDKKGINPYSEENLNGDIRHIYLRSSADNEIELTLVVTKDFYDWIDDIKYKIIQKFPNIKTIYININRNNTNVILGDIWKKIYGAGFIKDMILQNSFLIAPASFYQVNRDMAEILYNKAFEIADFQNTDIVCDLYCGVGTIGLSLAKRVKKIVGVEIIPQAIENAKENARINDIQNAEFYCGDAGNIFEGLKEKFDAVILDPPRKGISSDLAEIISKNNINKVLYISCAFDTLCRDIKVFREFGYDTSFIQPVDMFPRTSHVESVVCMTRN